MLRVRIENAKPGMTIASPVAHPERPGTTLLNAGVKLEERSIERLAEIPVFEIWVEHPAVRDLGEQVSPTVLRAQADVAENVIEAIDGAIEGCDGRMDYVKYRDAIQDLILAMLHSPRSIVFVEEMIRNGRPVVAHAANVCIMSVMMGLKLADYLVEQRTRLKAWYARDVTSLGLGAMFHDIGMFQLEPEVLARWREHRSDFDPEWRAHTTLGWEMVREQIGPAGASAVLHHHQRFDGSGFPSIPNRQGAKRAVVGKDIHVFARIVAVADALDALRFPDHEAPLKIPDETQEKRAEERPAVPMVRALKQLREPPYKEWLDPFVLLALLSVVPPYSPGSVVKLSNGRDAVVVDWSVLDPCRPTVRTIDLEKLEQAKWDDGMTYMLAGSEGITVVEAEGFDVSQDNFYPETATEFCLETAAKRLINAAPKAAG